MFCDFLLIYFFLNAVLYVTAHTSSGGANDCYGLLVVSYFATYPTPAPVPKYSSDCIYLFICYFLQPLKLSYLKIKHGTSVHVWPICKLECWLYV